MHHGERNRSQGRRWRRGAAALLALALVGPAAAARAEDPPKDATKDLPKDATKDLPKDAPEDPHKDASKDLPKDAIVLSRRRFSEGNRLAQEAQWADALAAFEESAALHAHPVTTYNIGYCERALGRYTRARRALMAALAEREGSGATLPAPIAEQARAYLAELDRMLVRAEVTVSPADATLAVDGRPLQRDAGGEAALVAGLAPAGPGATSPAAFTLLVDPGSHLFTLSRKGYSDVFVGRTLPAGARPALLFELSRLPARLQIRASQPGAAVAIDGVDVGAAPVAVERPAGSYALLVRKQGFEPYDTRFTVAAGEALDLTASLTPRKAPLVRKWWFWTAVGLGALAVGGVTWAATYQPPPLDGGGLHWAVKAP